MSYTPGDTLYQFRTGAKPVLQWQRDNASSLAAYRDNALAVPTGGTYKLYGPREDLDSADPVSTGSVVVTSSIATYTVPAADLPSTVSLGPDWLEIWALDMPDGKTYTVRRMVAVGRYQLFPPLTLADLVDGEYPDLIISMGPDGAAQLQKLLDAEWASMMRFVESYGTWADVIVDSADVFEMIRHGTLARAFAGMLMHQANQRWQSLMDRHTDLHTSAKQGLRITVDRDRDGRPDHFGKESVMTTITPNIPPRKRSRSTKWG